MPKIMTIMAFMAFMGHGGGRAGVGYKDHGIMVFMLGAISQLLVPPLARSQQGALRKTPGRCCLFYCSNMMYP